MARTDLEDTLIEANKVHHCKVVVNVRGRASDDYKYTNTCKDPSIHGILVYYPVFGVMDTYLQDVVCIEKDVEGMNTKYPLIGALYCLPPPVTSARGVLCECCEHAQIFTPLHEVALKGDNELLEPLSI